MNYTAASLILQVLSAAKVVTAGIILSSMLELPTIFIRSPIFSIKLTITSVLLFLSRIDTIGIKCCEASSEVRDAAN